MGATMHANGTTQQRKTLANQLDRLDGILDVLGDGLNEAVAGAVEQAVGAAVSSAVASVLTELLTNPEVVTRLREAMVQASPPVAAIAVPVPAQPSPSPTGVPYTNRVRDYFRTAKEKLASLATNVRKKVSGFGVKVKGWLGTLSSKAAAFLRFAKPYRRAIMLSAGVGLAIGMTTFFAGRYFAAVVGCLAGFATALGVQAAVALRRLMGLATST